MPFFQQPFYCSKTTILSTLTIECSKNIAFAGLPTLPKQVQYSMEIFLSTCFIIIQIISIRERILLGTNSRRYIILQSFLLTFLSVSIGENIYSLLTSRFPIITLLLKGVILVMLIRNLRVAWYGIFVIFYKTKTVFFLILINILMFGLIGFLFFGKEDGDFSTVIKSMYSLYILLSTCNFPDVMLSTLTISKFAAFYFAIYIIINLFILLSLLKALYFYVYFEHFKKRTEKIMDFLGKLDNYKDEKFFTFIAEINDKYNFTSIEKKELLKFLGIDMIYLTSEYEELRKQETLMTKNKILIELNKKRVEGVIVAIDFFFVFVLKDNPNRFALALLLVWCIFFMVEFFIYFHYLGISKMLKKEIVRVVLAINNFIVFVCCFCLQKYGFSKENENFIVLFQIAHAFIVIRVFRIFIFLNLFKEFQTIFKILDYMKEIFLVNCLTLFSYFFLFSTFSIIFTGGNIKTESFINNREIPNNYYFINFNDYANSFLACFALTMVNNLNILAKSLAYNTPKELQQGFYVYFATFYFFSTLMILNIIQTLLLEMYLLLKSLKLIRRKEKKENKLEKEKEKSV